MSNLPVQFQYQNPYFVDSVDFVERKVLGKEGGRFFIFLRSSLIIWNVNIIRIVFQDIADSDIRRDCCCYCRA